MTYGELKLETIKICHALYDAETVENLENMKYDERYSRFLRGFTGAVNRAFQRIVQKGVLPLKSYVVKCETPAEGDSERFNLKELISDFGWLERVVFDGSRGYVGETSYGTEGDGEIILPSLMRGDSYRFIYHPALPEVEPWTDDADEVPLPSYLAAAVPYSVKGDILEEDEPSLAVNAKNVFEALLDDFVKPTAKKQNDVKRVFRV